MIPSRNPKGRMRYSEARQGYDCTILRHIADPCGYWDVLPPWDGGGGELLERASVSICRPHITPVVAFSTQNGCIGIASGTLPLDIISISRMMRKMSLNLD